MNSLDIKIDISKNLAVAQKKCLKLQLFSLAFCIILLSYDFSIFSIASKFSIFSTGILFGVSIFSFIEFLLNLSDYKSEKRTTFYLSKLRDENTDFESLKEQYNSSIQAYKSAKEECEKSNQEIKELMKNYKCQICSNKEINNV